MLIRGQVQVLTHILARDIGNKAIRFTCFYIGVCCRGNPCEHEENLQTPHRKAREITYLALNGRDWLQGLSIKPVLSWEL